LISCGEGLTILFPARTGLYAGIYLALMKDLSSQVNFIWWKEEKKIKQKDYKNSKDKSEGCLSCASIALMIYGYHYQINFAQEASTLRFSHKHSPKTKFVIASLAHYFLHVPEFVVCQNTGYDRVHIGWMVHFVLYFYLAIFSYMSTYTLFACGGLVKIAMYIREHADIVSRSLLCTLDCELCIH
jgi:hypothetical protein